MTLTKTYGGGVSQYSAPPGEQSFQTAACGDSLDLSNSIIHNSIEYHVLQINIIALPERNWEVIQQARLIS